MQEVQEVQEELAGIVHAWDVGAVLATGLPASGTINQTVLLTTSRGRYVLRGYHHRERTPVAREHAVIAHVCAHGLPAVAPLALPGGETILEHGGRFYALFPWAEGRQVARAALGAEETAAMGTCLGQLHLALRRFPPDQAGRRTFAFDPRATLAQMDRLEATIRAGAHTDPLASVALARLAAQRAHVETLPEPEAARVEFSPAAAQVIHGDYQETNLFFAPGRVSAVIDWDQTYLASPAWEVMRVLDYVFGFQPTPCHRFLRAYRAARPLSLEDLDAAAAAYDVKVSHSLWLFEAYYFEGNQRVARFLHEGAVGPFVPLSERWARVRDACAPGAPQPDA